MRPHGESILEIVLSVRSARRLPEAFLTRGIVCINGEVVPRDMWSMVRPKPYCASMPISVTLHYPLQGPGSGGGSSTTKSIIGIVAAIALIIVTQGIASGALLGAGGMLAGVFPFAAGSLSAQLLAGAVGIAGALAISALTAPPIKTTEAGGGSNEDTREAAGASGNVIEPGGPILRVIGTRKVYPPYICEPLVELTAEGDEYVEVVCALNGPHALDDIRIDGVTLDSAQDVEIETREGWDDDTDLTLVTRYGRTAAPNIQLSTHALQTNQQLLQDQSTPANSLPVFHRVVSRDTPDEIWMHLIWPGGIVDGSTPSNVRIVAHRIRFRQVGSSTWINFPELHFAPFMPGQIRTAILFKWASQGSINTPPAPGSGTYGWIAAHINVPAQTATPSGGGWTADSYFDDGSGVYYLIAASVAGSRVINVNLYEKHVEIYLDEGTFPKGRYEFEVMRSHTFIWQNFAIASYTYAGATVYDFFSYFTNGSSQHGIIASQQSVSAVGSLIRLVSVWFENPVQDTGFALIALRARNRQINRLSVAAAGYVQDWSGSAWEDWTTTSKPAAHYRDILVGAQNLDPLDESLIDDDTLLDWRQSTIDNDWNCDTIVDDERTQDSLALLASCGYAKPYQSDVYGVTVDDDRTDDAPEQVFSRMNARNIHWERSFSRVPYGFIVTYRDNELDDDRAQTIVDQADPSIATDGMYESVSYEGLVDQNHVRTRARFDLDQANMRATFYYLETDLEALMVRRGSLVGFQHDTIERVMGDARIRFKITDGGGNITAIYVDSALTYPDDTGTDIAISIRHRDGAISTHQIAGGWSGGDHYQIDFDTPYADTDQIAGFEDTNHKYGCLVTFGLIGRTYRRCLVQAINPAKDLTATLVLVDEAPDLNRVDPP